MKYWKPLALSLATILALLAAVSLHVAFSRQPTGLHMLNLPADLGGQFHESCLSPDHPGQGNYPVWECYEISVDESPHQPVTVRHESGEAYQVLTFRENNQTKFRFTPTQQGVWTFSTGGEIAINADRPAYAKGFVTAAGNKWIRSATQAAFVPQFLMYNKFDDLDAGLDEFVEGHGFSGFHITNLRDFMRNPSYFEAVVLKTYRRGGVTHFWLWGDEQRSLTPSTYDVDTDLLYAEIAARLAPLPGWTVGYGFDLFEWSTASEIESFREKLRADCSYHHMVGARGHKNEYTEISDELDYASWEWHRPSYSDYKDHLEHSEQRPAFSEDRFRIWESIYPGDYSPELTYQGLWDSTMAGGVANIWGHQLEGEDFSEPYPNKEEIKTYSTFISATFSADMRPDNALVNQGRCLRGSKSAICYSQQPKDIRFTLDDIEMPVQIVAVDTRKAYRAIELSVSDAAFDWQPPYPSDWAFHIFSQAANPS